MLGRSLKKHHLRFKKKKKKKEIKLLKAAVEQEILRLSNELPVVVASNERLLCTFSCSMMYLFSSCVPYLSCLLLCSSCVGPPKELCQCGVGGKSVGFQSCYTEQHFFFFPLLLGTWICASVLFYIFLIGMKFNRNLSFLSAYLPFGLALQISKSSVTASLCAYIGGKETEK